jgi:ferredoxin/flavodoxin---NADP+ reductase
VTAVLADADAGLPRGRGGSRAVAELLASRDVTVVDWGGWQAIDAAERKSGTEASRPRLKLVARSELLEAALG